MRNAWVECWHPDSPGIRVMVWRPWYRTWNRPFASAGELKRAWWKPAPFSNHYVPYGEMISVIGGPNA